MRRRVHVARRRRISYGSSSMRARMRAAARARSARLANIRQRVAARRIQRAVRQRRARRNPYAQRRAVATGKPLLVSPPNLKRVKQKAPQ